jgi:Ca-activated chloride channel family protein
MIRFLAPAWLAAAVPVLALAGVYVWRQLHRRAYAVRFTNVALLERVAPNGLGYRRHLAPAALLLVMLTLAGASARPAINARTPVQRATVVIAIDVSLSMQATDVAPTRIAAAQQAAKGFVAMLPDSYNIGLVSFAGTASVLVAPGKDKAAVDQAIDALQLAEATATGDAVFTSLDAIKSVPADGASGPPPARIVLLSDGYRTAGRPIEDAAAAAAAANVPVSTIAFGTDGGTVDIQGEVTPVPVDKASLGKLAEVTRGHYYEAGSLSQLNQVYRDLGSSIGHTTKPREITQWWAGAALLIALAGGGLSLLWTSRLP